jgi:hypothetical protein
VRASIHNCKSRNTGLQRSAIQSRGTVCHATHGHEATTIGGFDRAAIGKHEARRDGSVNFSVYALMQDLLSHSRGGNPARMALAMTTALKNRAR